MERWYDLGMSYEIEFLDDATRNTVVVTAPDEETALFLAGMKFSEMDINPDRIEVTRIRNTKEAMFT
jgi:hypothetical protein